MGDKYDFRFHPMPNWTVHSSFWTGTGFLYVNGELAYGTIGAGAPLCKYGRETGYACGLVRNPDYFFNHEQSRGYILWRANGSYTSTHYGDSGGPVFSEPVRGYVKAAALMVNRHQENPYIDSVMMPIDYINDVYAVSLVY